MLCLTLKPGECVVMSNGCYAYLNHVRQGQARLSFSVPDDVRVLRGKLLDPSLVEAVKNQTATPEMIKIAFAEADAKRNSKRDHQV